MSYVIIFFFSFFSYSETGFLCVTVLAVLELALVDQAGLELMNIYLPLPRSTEIKRHASPLPISEFYV